MKIRNWSIPLTLTLTLTLSLTSSVFAQSATDSAQDLRDSVQKKVEEELSQIKKAVSKKSFLGSITSKNEAAVNLVTYRNEPRQALVTAETVIKLKNGRDGTPKDLNVGDYILVMGEVDSQNLMTAKRLLVVPAPTEDTRRIVYGRISGATTNSVTVTPVSGEPVTAKLLASSAVNRTEAGASVKIKITDIEVESKAVIITKTTTSTVATDLQIVAPPAPTPVSKISP